jgi:hypothetical protein
MPRAAEQQEPDKMSEYISDRNNMLLAVVLLVAITLVMLLLMFKNVDVAQSANYAEFNQKMALFFVSLMVAMTICLLWKFLGKENAMWLGIGLIASSAVLAAVFAQADIATYLVGLSLPSYVVAVGASAVKLAKSRIPGSLRKTLQKAGPHIVHMGIAFVLMSYVVSSEMQELPSSDESSESTVFTLGLGQGLEVGAYTLVLTDLEVQNEYQKSGALVVREARTATFDILRSGEPVKEGVVVTDLYSYTTGGVPQVVEIGVHVYKSAIEDLYISFQWLNYSSAYVEAKTIPMMNTLWAGLGLLILGIVVRTAAWQIEPKEMGRIQKAASENGPR